MHVVHGGSGLPEPHWVDDQEHLKVQASVIRLQDLTNEVTNLTLGLNLPIAIVEV